MGVGCVFTSLSCPRTLLAQVHAEIHTPAQVHAGIHPQLPGYMLRYTRPPLPMNRITDTCENITFASRTVITRFEISFLHYRSWSQPLISISRLSNDDACTENDAASGITEAPDARRWPTGHGCDATDRSYSEVGAPAKQHASTAPGTTDPLLQPRTVSKENPRSNATETNSNHGNGDVADVNNNGFIII